MYGRTPHTRPVGVSGRATEESVQDYLKAAGVRTSGYGGPTTIMLMASELAPERGMEMMHLLVQLPPYIRVEEDIRGQEALLRALDGLYGFNLNMDSLVQQGDKQYQELNRLVRRNPQMRALIRRLEWDYDSQSVGLSGSEDDQELPPDIEGFLRELEGTEPEE
jgi:predicted ATP-grasp superfamily ATP-dependent carboligase